MTDSEVTRELIRLARIEEAAKNRLQIYTRRYKKTPTPSIKLRIIELEGILRGELVDDIAMEKLENTIERVLSVILPEDEEHEQS